MRQFVESLRRLYVKEMVSKEKILNLYESNRISKEEQDYILQST